MHGQFKIQRQIQISEYSQTNGLVPPTIMSLRVPEYQKQLQCTFPISYQYFVPQQC